jgi:hypothetical protein
MLTFHWQWAIFLPIMATLLVLLFVPRRSNHGNFTPDTSGLAALFWGVVLVIFVLIWGGVFWW